MSGYLKLRWESQQNVIFSDDRLRIPDIFEYGPFRNEGTNEEDEAETNPYMVSLGS